MKSNKKYRWGMKLAALALSSSVLFSTVESASAATYTVQSGDSLWKIATQHGISYQTLMNANHLSSSTIYVGQKLTINKQLSSVSNTTSKVLQVAKQQLGVKYTFGGAKPSTGFDCSGYITYVFNQAGISTPRKTAAGFYQTAKKVSTPQIGDIVFFANTYKAGISHAGIYIGNNQMINASNSGVSVANINSTYWKKHFVGYGRLK
ncbi:NlpC/P60 family protein [Lysinibacillus irui]|uniref:NlpC/P60 family protein n=1 Tax=Lysinibacillus irui TaxID=2998077 RepID=A0AAJ5RNM5_9BACI|nr:MULTISPECIES: NlpC/P60 family protein [Lysinibacillus]MEA0552331.1 NlpC/P60 family protein [Lysinibacillus irui]MEA0563966.1 NlpC/P60 family protein [Lysinibacillus irui]MEA0977463.1 NlpC/P60 family protein [Lysinibacillus irui]MEA1043617.1 NlpC/P60 family protein [Lysinibacillus irui]WDV08361.1 NlpC/P60 family protein [Lysinibacillus irui]